MSPSEPSSCTARIRPLVAQTFETSSIAISASSVAGAGAAVLLVVEEAEDPLVAVELDDVPRELVRRVDLRRARRDPLARERADELAELALLVAQDVPGQRAQWRRVSSRCSSAGTNLLTSTISSAGTFALRAASTIASGDGAS